MRISDWSSDVCSSDLPIFGKTRVGSADCIGFQRLFQGNPLTQHPAAKGLTTGILPRHRRSNASKGIGRFHWCIRSKSQRHMVVRSEEHTSELQSLMRISYAVFCLKKKKN